MIINVSELLSEFIINDIRALLLLMGFSFIIINCVNTY